MKYTLLFVCLAGSLFAQTDNVNTIKVEANAQNFEKYTSIAEPTPEQMDTIMALTMTYCQSDKDTCFLLCDFEIESAKNYAGELLQAETWITYGDALQRYGNTDESEKYLSDAKELLLQLNEIALAAHVDVKLGVLDVPRGNNEAAIKHFLDAIEMWQTVKDSQFIFQPYMNIAWVYYNMKELDKAQSYLSKAIDWAELLKNEQGQMYGHTNQAEMYLERIKEYSGIADTIKNDAHLYRDTVITFFAAAKTSTNRSLDIAQKMNHEYMMVSGQGFLFELELIQKNYARALELGITALSAANKLGAPVLILRNNINLSKANRELGKLDKSINYAKQAYQVAEQNNFKEERSLATEELYRSYKQRGKAKEALTQLEDFSAYQKEKNKTETKKAISEAEAKFQVVEKEKLILEQDKNILQLEFDRTKAVKQRNYLSIGGLLLGLLGFFGFRFNKLKRERNDKKEFAEALIFAQEEERKRIARDLHDGVGQSLLLIKKQMANTHQTTLANQELISDTLDEVRSISQDLHPMHLEKFGLTASIENVMEKVEKSSELFISSEMVNVDKLLSAKSEIHLFRTIQEAFNNIVKHAAATAAKLTISRSTDGLEIIIQDNGKGFDHEISIAKSKSLGLKTMHERIAAIGGEFKLESGEPKGTQVIINIPHSKMNQ